MTTVVTTKKSKRPITLGLSPQNNKSFLSNFRNIKKQQHSLTKQQLRNISREEQHQQQQQHRNEINQKQPINFLYQLSQPSPPSSFLTHINSNHLSTLPSFSISSSFSSSSSSSPCFSSSSSSSFSSFLSTCPPNNSVGISNISKLFFISPLSNNCPTKVDSLFPSTTTKTSTTTNTTNHILKKQTNSTTTTTDTVTTTRKPFSSIIRPKSVPFSTTTSTTKQQNLSLILFSSNSNQTTTKASNSVPDQIKKTTTEILSTTNNEPLRKKPTTLLPIATKGDGPTKILNFLYLGSNEDVLSPYILKKHNLTHVINATTNCTRPSHVKEENFLRIPINDSQQDPLLSHFEQAFQFIDSAKEKGGRVLVHCLAGISRSASVVIGYLIMKYNFNYNSAFAYVKSKRSSVAPNFNFLGQLLQFEKEVFEKNNQKALNFSSHTSMPDFISPQLTPSPSSLSFSECLPNNISIPIEGRCCSDQPNLSPLESVERIQVS